MRRARACIDICLRRHFPRARKTKDRKKSINKVLLLRAKPLIL